MVRLLSCALAVVCLIDSGPMARAAAPSGIMQLSVIPLRDGVNEMDDFAGDGRRGTIIEAWRDNGNAHGYHVFLVVLESKPGRGDWNLVTVQRQSNDPERDLVNDNPHTVEDAVSSVRFARGLVDGKPATLLIVAARDLGKATSFIDPAPVDIEFYRLVRREDGLFGWPPDYFDLIETVRSPEPYCNSDLALTKEIGLPLPESYAGPNRDDGCLH